MKRKFIITLLVLVFIKTELSYSQNETGFYRSPQLKDSVLISNNSDLIGFEPTNKNGKEYYQLAQAFWETENNSKAEKMFRKIEESEIELFNQTILFNSDIPGDTIQNILGYGSYTFDYKNKASIYLTKILIENENYKHAINYLTLADNEYQVKFNCGTGQNSYRRQIENLYALCYEGLNQNEKVIELLLPSSLRGYNLNNKILLRVLKKTYTLEERLAMKESAINSISFSTNESELGKYAEGFIVVFDHKLKLGSVFLKNINISPTQYFINLYKDSQLYNEVFKFGHVSFDK